MEVLERKCINPLRDELERIHAVALESISDFEAGEGTEVRRIGKLRGEFILLYKELVDLKASAQGMELNQIDGILSDLEALSRHAHDSTTCTYVPLEELYSMNQAS